MHRSEAEWKELFKDGITAGPLPPGGRDGLYASALKAVEAIEKVTGPLDGLKIAEIGSGNGRIAIGLLEKKVEEYRGVEILSGCVDFCVEAFRPWKNFSFGHVDVMNQRYNGLGKVQPDKVHYPFEDGHYDLALLMSVVTHVPEHDAVEHILAEAWRILKPGGRLLVTWFVAKSRADASADPAKVVFRRGHVTHFIRDWEHLKEEVADDVQLYILLRKP